MVNPRSSGANLAGSPQLHSLAPEKKENPDNIRMENDSSRENEVNNQEFIDDDAIEEVEDNITESEKRNTDPVFQK